MGTYTIVATYNPSSNFNGSNGSNTLTVGARSTTTVAANANSTYSEQPVNVTLNATVASVPAGSSTVNAGTVTFQVMNGATNVGSAVTSATVVAGAASVTYSLPLGTVVGAYTIVATYNPSANFVTSSDTKTLNVGARSTTTTAVNVTVAYGSAPTLAATVAATGSSVNAGTVTFQVKQGLTNIGSAVTDTTIVDGQASVSYPLPSSAVVGAYTIVATYNPSSNFTGSSGTATLTIVPREANVAYIGQTVFVSSGSSSTTAQVTLSASVADIDGSGSVFYGTVTFTDMLTGKVLASGVKVSPVSNTDTRTGTANTIVTLSTGQYGAQQYLIEVSLGGSYKNCQQTGPITNTSGTYCSGAPTPTATAYAAAHATVVVMIPPTQYSIQGAGSLSRLTTTPAGTYGDASAASYSIGLKYNKSGTNPQGQVQLLIQRPDGLYLVKSNSITSLAFSNGTPAKDVTVYTKANISRLNPNGTVTALDGNVTLRIDAHEGCTTSPSCPSSAGDTIGFTVLSSKTSALYYSSNWTYDAATRSWRTVSQSMPSFSAVVIN